MALTADWTYVPLLTQPEIMIDRSKKITARFYLTPTGRKPVREWLLELSEDDRRVVGKDIQKVEFGWPIGMPYCRRLAHGLWEVRSNLSGGRIARVIFSIVGGRWSCCMVSRRNPKGLRAPTSNLRSSAGGRL